MMSGNTGAANRALPPGIRVNQIATLPHLNEQQKANYTRGVANLYDTFQKHEKDSPEYRTAAQKLMEFTQKMGKEVKEWKERQATGGAANAQQQGGVRPQSQGQPGQQQQQQPQSQPQQASQASAQQTTQQQIAPKIMQHVQSYSYSLPPNIASGTPEAENKIKEMKSTYAAALARSEQLSTQVKKIQAMAQERQASGQEIPPQWQTQKQALETQWQNAQRFINDFRAKQDQYKNMAQQAQAQTQTQQSSQQVQQAQQAAAAPPQPQIKTEGGTNQQQQQQQPNQQPPQPQPQPPQQPVINNPAVEAARQQLNRGSMSPVTTAQPQQPQPQQQQQQQPAQAQNTSPFQQGAPAQQTPVQQQRPQLNPQQAAAQMNQMHQNSPHTGPPVPLTHGQAMTAAARTYSDQRTTPQIPASQGYQMGNRDQISNPKMPIPKTLSVPPPHPVNMGPARPTLGGPSNGAPGMMGQPVIAAHPQYHLEGDGERVLSKKKLDELVRQVTGGGEGPSGENLTPEVEEAMLQLADDFLDNVITSACKLAKLRESSTLEIRDIQCILERNYNIRIPGYASDEIRTVRKFQPAPGWTQKMNAVQAAKVMGGKTD